MNFVSGLANCHLPNLYSFAISERQSEHVGMRRIFYSGLHCRMDLWDDGGDFRLKPHNHRQNIKLSLLFGNVQNVSIGLGPHGTDLFHVWKYRFGSALLDGQFSVERMNEEQCSLTHTPLTSEPLTLHWNDVHTVVADPGSMWLVEEGELAPPGMERCWSTNHRLKLSNAGLYEPMSRVILDGFAAMIETKMGRSVLANA